MFTTKGITDYTQKFIKREWPIYSIRWKQHEPIQKQLLLTERENFIVFYNTNCPGLFNFEILILQLCKIIQVDTSLSFSIDRNYKKVLGGAIVYQSWFPKALEKPQGYGEEMQR